MLLLKSYFSIRLCGKIANAILICDAKRSGILCQTVSYLNLDNPHISTLKYYPCYRQDVFSVFFDVC